MRNILPAFLLACMTTPLIAGGAATDSSSTATRGAVIITSTPGIASVLLDAVFRGTTPLTLDSVTAGRHSLRLVGRTPSDWFSGTVDDTITVETGVPLRLQYHIPQRTALLSSPGSAEVYSGDSLLGVTPFLIGENESVLQPLVLKKAGYANVIVQPVDSSGTVVIATLTPVWQPQETHGESEEPETVSNKTPVIIAGAVAVAAGVGAAYFKIKADRREGEFAVNQNPGTHNDVQHLDLIAAVFLVVSQAGMVAFSAMLLNQ